MVNQVGQQLESPSYAKTDINPQQRYQPTYDDQGASRPYAQPSRSPRGVQDYEQASTSPRGNQGHYQHPLADQGYGQAPGGSSPNPRVSGNFSDVDEAKAARRASIPRKQVGTSGHTPHSSITSSPVSSNYPSQAPTQPPPPVPKHRDLPTEQPAYQNLRSPTHESTSPQDSRYYNAYNDDPQNTNRNAQQQYQEPSAVPQGLNYRGGNRDQSDDFQSKAPPLFPRAEPVPKGLPSRSAPQDIVQRAQTNTKDTEIIEKIAPGMPPIPLSLKTLLPSKLSLVH